MRQILQEYRSGGGGGGVWGISVFDKVSAVLDVNQDVEVGGLSGCRVCSNPKPQALNQP